MDHFNVTHGHAKIGKVSRTYRAWQNMKKRCYCPSTTRFERWGGRGIRVCTAWLSSFEYFLEDMGECPDGHSLDRIDNDGNYEPDNCRWGTAEEQGAHKSNSRMLTVGSHTKTLTQWAGITGLDKRTIFARLKRGYTDEAAIDTRLDPRGSKC